MTDDTKRYITVKGNYCGIPCAIGDIVYLYTGPTLGTITTGSTAVIKEQRSTAFFEVPSGILSIDNPKEKTSNIDSNERNI